MYIIDEVRGNQINVRDELETLKTSQIRVTTLSRLLHFYEVLPVYVDFYEDVFDCYKENYEENKDEYQEDIKVFFQRAGIQDYDLEKAIAHTEEKRILLHECIRFIIICISGTVIPKRKEVKETRKITKARLIETIKNIEQFVLSIHLSSSNFQSPFFKETQQIRISFMLDAIHHLLSLTSIKPVHYPFIFDPKIVLQLEETKSSSKQFSIMKHLKRRYKTVMNDHIFHQDFLGRFRLRIEKLMKEPHIRA